MSAWRHWLLVAYASAACAPTFEDQPYLVERPRVLAVVVEPPEARPRAELSLTPTIAGRGAASSLSFRFCTSPPSPGDPRAVSPRCLEQAGVPLESGGGRAVGTLPADACSRFGPNPVGGQQPRDADATGGFYQPIVVDGVGPTAVAFVRVLCPLSDTPVALARELQTTYTPNENPHGFRLEQERGGAWQALGALRAGEPAALRVVWDEDAREPYVWLPPDGRRLEPRREALRLSWFVSAGALREATTGRAEADDAFESPNLFTPPPGASSVELWVIVRDDRGGSAVLHESLAIGE